MSDSLLNNGALLSSLLSGQTASLDLKRLLAAQVGGGQDLVLNQDGLPVDERLNAALSWLEQRRAVATQNAPVEDNQSEAEIELQHLDVLQQQRAQQEEQRAQARQLRSVMKRLYAELEMLRARSDMLASALGACYVCFGEDLSCPECGGRGVSGSLLPDATAFRTYVAPAVNRIRTTKYQARNDHALPGAGIYQSQDPGTASPT